MFRLLRRVRDVRWEAKGLKRVPELACRAERLLPESEVSLEKVFNSREVGAEWEAAAGELHAFDIRDGTGEVNPGDRRAIFHLLGYFRARSVLEVGTHVGASTVSAAAALRAGRGAEEEQDPALVSVDVRDVNDPVSKPWARHGSPFSPAEMVGRMGCADFTEFVARPSLEYMAGCARRFRFIFLDGDHSAQTVYREIPAALELLEGGGLILLHDYYPGLRPLWPDGVVIPGPYLAARRLSREGAHLKVLPLGRLPWPTKLGSHVTSLALLVRKDVQAARG
jgi:predicted O-methyltransferase YrrM